MAVNLNALVRTAPSNPERLNRKEAAAREAQWMLEMDRALMGGAKKSDGQPLSAVQGASQQHDDAVPEFMQHRHEEDKDSAPPAPGLSAAPSMHLPSQSQLSLSQLQAQSASIEPAQAEVELRPAVSTAARFGAHAAYGKFAAPEPSTTPSAMQDASAAQQMAVLSPATSAAQLNPVQVAPQAAVSPASAPAYSAQHAALAAPIAAVPMAQAVMAQSATPSTVALANANQPSAQSVGQIANPASSLPSQITGAAAPIANDSTEVAAKSTPALAAPVHSLSNFNSAVNSDAASNALSNANLAANVMVNMPGQLAQAVRGESLQAPSNVISAVTALQQSTTSAAFAASKVLSAQVFQSPAQADLPEMPELPMEDEVKMAFGEKTKSESEAFDKTRLHVQQAKDGVHAWVRDADLSHAQVRDLARNMRSEFAAQGNTLAALSVNGKKIISKVETTSHEDVWLPEAEEVKTTPLVTSVSSLPKQGEA